MEMLLTILLLISGLTLITYLFRKYQVKERRVAVKRRESDDRRDRTYGRRISNSEYLGATCRRSNISDRRIGAVTRRRFSRREGDLIYAGNSFR